MSTPLLFLQAAQNQAWNKGIYWFSSGLHIHLFLSQFTYAAIHPCTKLLHLQNKGKQCACLYIYIATQQYKSP